MYAYRTTLLICEVLEDASMEKMRLLINKLIRRGFPPDLIRPMIKSKQYSAVMMT